MEEVLPLLSLKVAFWTAPQGHMLFDYMKSPEASQGTLTFHSNEPTRTKVAQLAHPIAGQSGSSTPGTNAIFPPGSVHMAVLWAQALRATRVEQATAAPKVTAASQAEVSRVLGAKSDLEVMQLRPGTEAAAVKKKYRTMTLALHPDKCKVRNPPEDICVKLNLIAHVHC